MILYLFGLCLTISCDLSLILYPNPEYISLQLVKQVRYFCIKLNGRLKEIALPRIYNKV
jgi:hypothetical protein